MTKPTLKRRQPNSTLPARTKSMPRAKATPGSRKPRKGRKPLAKRNAKRREREFARCYHSAERVAFVRSLPCCVCGNASTAPCENAHIMTGGMGRKADARFIVPLCSPHHQSLHKRGRPDFEARYAISLDKAAHITETLWRRHLAAVGPIPQEDR